MGSRLRLDHTCKYLGTPFLTAFVTHPLVSQLCVARAPGLHPSHPPLLSLSLWGQANLHARRPCSIAYSCRLNSLRASQISSPELLARAVCTTPATFSGTLLAVAQGSAVLLRPRLSSMHRKPLIAHRALAHKYGKCIFLTGVSYEKL